MLKLKHFLFTSTLAVLVVGLASNGLALQLSGRTSQGNNFGLQMAGGSGVLTGSHEYPRGTGNMIYTYEGGWGHHMYVVRDINGDGTLEDSCNGSSRGRTIGGILGSLEAYDIIKQGFDTGQRMSQWAGRVENGDETFSSLDPDNVERWPAEFRVGHTLSGEPVIRGAETMARRHSDAWNTSYPRSVPPLGVSFEYEFFFLNFRETNDMAFGQLFIRNMSEYLKWNDNLAFRAQVANSPDGLTWGSLCLGYVENYIGLGEPLNSDLGWASNQEKNLKCLVDRNGYAPGFKGSPYAYNFGYKVLRHASWNGETMYLRNLCHQRWGSEFGLSIEKDIVQLADPAQVYRWAACLQPDGTYLNMTDMWGTQLNAWTGRPDVGKPGAFLPTDFAYDKWIWGRNSLINYGSYGELHDFGPRDTCSTSFAIICCFPKNPPLIMKPATIANLYDPDIESQMSTMEQMGDIVDIIYRADFEVPYTPVAPPLTIVPGDRKVTITWSDVNLNTPDGYYYKLQALGANPNGYYKEYDFEGYRLYRNYTGASEPFAECIDSCSKTAGNLHFYFIDSNDLDINYGRLRNGLRVWYALVPYDKNYDPISNAMYSLPEPGSSKTWNRTDPPGYFTVRPRSDASNYRGASAGALTYISPSSTVTPLSETSVKLAGDGTGNLLEEPKYLAPKASMVLKPVLGEAMNEAFSVYVECYGLEWYNDDPGCSSGHYGAGARKVRLLDASGNILDGMAAAFRARYSGDPQPASKTVGLNGEISAEGQVWALTATFENLNLGNDYYWLDVGTYTGAAVRGYSDRCSGNPGTAPGNWAYALNGKFSVKWVAAGDSLTLEVKDETRGISIPFSPYLGKGGWGLTTTQSILDNAYDDDRLKRNLETTTYKCVSKVAASYNARVDFVVNGITYRMDPPSGSSTLTLPSNGTTFYTTTAFGSWNSDKTEFTQYVDPVYIGDKWKLDVVPSSMAEDSIDLGRVRVVPNPYVFTSVLDNSSGSRRIDFVNLPDRCTIRIYTLAGNLVNVLNHTGNNRMGWGTFTDIQNLKPDNTAYEFTGYDNHSGTEPWNLHNRFGQTVASGLYFFHVTDARGKTCVGKFYIVN